MFKKGDFKKLDLLGSGKKNTKIYKVIHLQTGKIYVLKEIEAKTLDKLNVRDIPPPQIICSLDLAAARCRPRSSSQFVALPPRAWSHLRKCARSW